MNLMTCGSEDGGNDAERTTVSSLKKRRKKRKYGNQISKVNLS
jgi:hypothetical protein